MAASGPVLLTDEQEQSLHKLQMNALDASGDRKKGRSLGYVPTPPEMVTFMVKLAELNCRGPCSVLEPACADAPFLKKFLKLHGEHHNYIGVEIDSGVMEFTTTHRHPNIRLVNEDFLLWDTTERFDIIIGNPPYGIVGEASHYPIYHLMDRKAEYKRRIKTWKGKYNIFGAFTEKSVQLLKPNGQLIFILPTTWLILDDFALLRQYLAQNGLVEVFYVGRVFPKVNVSAVVLRFTKGAHGLVLYDMSGDKWKAAQINEYPAFLRKTVYRGEIIRFEEPRWIEFEHSGKPLGSLFRIRFAARSPEFRKSGLIRTKPQPGDVPVLTGRNLSPGWIDYENSYSGWWMRREDGIKLRSFYGTPHLVIGHTKGIRLVCAIDWRCYPWREEYHLIPGQDVKVDWNKLEKYLNGEMVQEYLRTMYRDFSPHLTKTMLSLIPIPNDIAYVSDNLLQQEHR